MSAHVLFNLLNELEKEIKPHILSLFFATSLINSIIQDSIYHITLPLF